MSFNTSLSGLNAAQADLGVTSNNIANVNTTGFKESRAEFGDIFANAAFGRSARTAIGSGVILNRVAQQFSQGNLDFTSNILDLALAGDGFFVVAPNISSDERVYTRAGAFGVNSEGFVVNGTGQILQAFPVNQDGSVTSTSLANTVELQLPATAGTPQATSSIALGLNLSANAPALDPALFDPSDNDTFTASTSVKIYDSLGNSHIATQYYVKSNTAANTWFNFLYVDGSAVDYSAGTASGVGNNVALEIAFDNAGTLSTINGAAPASVDTVAIAYAGGAASATIGVSYSGSTQLAGTASDSFLNVNSLSQNGFATGKLTGIEVSDTGVVRANYTNGQSVALGKVALARFTNVQGLSQLGDSTWAETTDSGQAIAGEAGSNTFGLIRSGALEASNVDLTAELVDLITAQRNFQANARAIETNNAVTQTIIQIR
ncbi:MAG: flagellar hook protein FlgE [Gammaproteobacteria bacterium]|nr:flagellar hook protein FlgE [Gammaproteobacteria bacterium]